MSRISSDTEALLQRLLGSKAMDALCAPVRSVLLSRSRFRQEPGSGGKESAEITVRELAGYDVRALPATGDKVTRAGPLSAQAEAGNVKLVAGAWNADFLAELHAFPDGRYSDQVDAATLAFNRLALGAGQDIRVISPGGDAPPRRVLVRG